MSSLINKFPKFESGSNYHP